ncbi:MAG: YicC/YloC family endoribonuclease [Desulfobulbus oligotrophicus]|nr:YicC/YloC family endoribonuclease [Desulfobulbus oligotrophicus]
MRPRSMTGFGRGEASEGGKIWVAEIRTVNHRFLDQRVVLPRLFTVFEERVKKRIASVFDRGRVDVTFSLTGAKSIEPQLAINRSAALQYRRCLEELISEYGAVGPITLQDMLTLRDVISLEEQCPDLEIEWSLISASLDIALKDCDIMREKEGQALKDDLLAGVERFAAITQQIKDQLPVLLQQRQGDLRIRIQNLLIGIDIDPIRLAQEVAIIADKSDVAEEITRLESHITQFGWFLGSNEPVGRRLDFLLQEFLREVNTLSSKIANASIAHLGVEMKNQIEKLREQVQNIE